MTVYTCITNQKDALIEMDKEPGVNYICFSDQPFQSRTWTYQPIDKHHMGDPRRIARRYKLLSHIYFPREDTIWIDGRVALNVKPTEMFAKYKGVMAARPHPSRTCIYAEAEVVKKQNYDHHSIVDKQMKLLKRDNYPQLHGLNETGCLMRRSSEQIDRFNECWWAWLSAYSKRDQLSFNYVAWKLRVPIIQMQRDDIILRKHKKTTNVNN